jgi:recombination DNA repair RAD52 pathway protein
MLSARYRAEARKLLRSLDDQLSPARQKAEEIVAREIGAPVPAAPASSKGKKSTKADKNASSKKAAKDETSENAADESDEEDPS